MPPESIAEIQSLIPKILEQTPYLKLLVLFGSRVRGDHFPSSDWDFALLFDEELVSNMNRVGDGTATARGLYFSKFLV